METNKCQTKGAGPKLAKHKKPYTAPKILGTEKLEAAAATCQPAQSPFGKSFPSPQCTTLGS